MKNISSSLRQSFEADVSTLCRLITITLSNGNVLRRTDLDRDVKVGINTFTSAGIDASAIRQSSVGGGNGGSISLILNEDADLTETMVRSGALSGAKYVIEVVDFRHPEYGTMILGVGRFTLINFNERGQCEIDLGSLTGSKGSQMIGEAYSQDCRNQFGDENCQVDLNSIKIAFTMDAILDSQTFIATELTRGDDNVFDFGVVEFTTGDNAGQTMEVAISLMNGTIFLAFPPPYLMNPGDGATIYPGCPKTVAACKGYNNLIHYRGEPDVPTVEEQNGQLPSDPSAVPPTSSSVTLKPFPPYAR